MTHNEPAVQASLAVCTRFTVFKSIQIDILSNQIFLPVPSFLIVIKVLYWYSQGQGDFHHFKLQNVHTFTIKDERHRITANKVIFTSLVSMYMFSHVSWCWWVHRDAADRKSMYSTYQLKAWNPYMRDAVCGKMARHMPHERILICTILCDFRFQQYFGLTREQLASCCSL